MAARGDVTFSKDVCDRIIDEIQAGRTLSDICNDPGMPSRRSVSRWINQDADFEKRYESAKGIQADVLFEKIIDTAEGRLDDEIIKGKAYKGKNESDNSRRHMIMQEREQRIRAYQFAISKLKPKKYGATQHVEISGNQDKPIQQVTRIELVAPQIPNFAGAQRQMDAIINSAINVLDYEIVDATAVPASKD